MAKRSLQSVRVLHLTDAARQLINAVRIEQSLSQSVLADKIGKRQPTVSAYLRGVFSVTPALCGALYDALGKDKRLDFLSYFAREDYSTHEDFLLDSARRLSEKPLYLLEPFYERIDEVYCAASTKARCDILGELEKLVLRYEPGYVIPQTTNKEPPTIV